MTASRFYLLIVCVVAALAVGHGERPAASPALADAGAKLPDRPPVSDAPVAAPAARAVRPGEVWLDNYRFRSGEVHPRLRIHYSTLGEPRRDAAGNIANAVLLLHWTGASGQALQGPAFLDALFGPGRPLDAARYYLIFIDNVGHGRSSKPSDGLRARFPHYGYRDMVDLQHRVLAEALGVKHLRAILGLSMGGMNAWQWAEMHPDDVDGIMPVVCLPARISGRNLLWRRIVAQSIRSDPEWDGGNYARPPRSWLQASAMVGMMLDGVPHLQATLPNQAAADRFVKNAAARAAAQDANDILYSLESSADYDPEPALGSIKARVYALNFGDDEFNPPVLRTLDRLMPSVPRGRHVILDGGDRTFGHSTMAHPELWASHVATFMRDLEPPAPDSGKPGGNPMNSSRFTVDHVRVTSDKPFDDVAAAFVRQLGKYDAGPLKELAAGGDAKAVRAKLEALAGPSGLMLFGTQEHGLLLRVVGQKRKAVQYIVGNPLVAVEMTQHDIRASLYAPLRVLIYEDEAGKTCLEYDRPSSLFGQFRNDQVAPTAASLDRKLEELVAKAIR
jgi:homoserine O-acetyltransferase/O-succinyltransferase